jgi:hypothetical protein
MACFLAAVAVLGLTHPAGAEDATSVWRRILKNCARTDVIGKDTLFFGVSNTIGPGSVWRFAQDGSLRLMFELSDAFPDEVDRVKLITVNNTGSCLGSSSSGWNLKLGLPFATPATAVSGDVGAMLSRARKVTVSITGFAVDVLKGTNWRTAFMNLGDTNPYVVELLQQNRLVAENVVKVTGLKAVFEFGTALGADVQASFKGRTITVGGDTSGAPSGSTTNSAPSAAGPTSPPAPAAPAASSVVDCGARPTAVPANNSGASAPPPSKQAFVRADLTSANQITVCADGPFYMLAAYSRLVGGKAGALSTATAGDLKLEPARVPNGAIPGIDGK